MGEPNTPVFLETNDVARALGLAAATVRQLTERGHLRPVATTRRGVQLYDPGDVARLKAQRAAGATRE